MALKFNIKTGAIKKPTSLPPAVKKLTSKPKKTISKPKKNEIKLTKNNLNFLRTLQ